MKTNQEIGKCKDYCPQNMKTTEGKLCLSFKLLHDTECKANCPMDL